MSGGSIHPDSPTSHVNGGGGRAIELRASRTPFVSATVVRVERPAPALPGDTAIVATDGTIEGFVGGVCSESSVRAQAMVCLATEQSVLLRVTAGAPSAANLDDASVVADPVGVVTVANPCLSGGTLEIFLEPVIPAPLVYTIGSSPIAVALHRAASVLGFDLRLVNELPPELPDDTAAVVVASHGRGEEAALTAALNAGIGYVGLVASSKRGAAVVDSLGRCSSHTDRISTPAGLDIGARTPEEVALSVLAEIVALRSGSEVNRAAGVVGHRPDDTDDSASSVAAAATAVDPVCGMTVARVSATLHVQHRGEVIYFCGSGCRQAFTADSAAYR